MANISGPSESSSDVSSSLSYSDSSPSVSSYSPPTFSLYSSYTTTSPYSPTSSLISLSPSPSLTSSFFFPLPNTATIMVATQNTTPIISQMCRNLPVLGKMKRDWSD